MKKYFVLLIVLCIMLCSCGQNVAVAPKIESGIRTVTDMSGETWELPDSIDSYAVAWAGLMDILTMYDGVEHMVAYPEKSASFKWLFDVFPELENKVCLSNDGISVETILETGAQVVFLKRSDDEALVDNLRRCGIVAIDCEFNDYEGLKKVVKLVAETLGIDSAILESEEYCEYLDNSVEYVQKIANEIPNDKKVSALVIRDTKDYSAYGVTRYTGRWVEMCGAIYSMINEDAYANVNLTKEQLIEYNPDVLFFAMPGQAEQFLDDDTWDSMKAVQNRTVYNNPGGFNTWSNCGAESALQFKWALSKLYPDLIDYNIEEEIIDFYNKFYDYKPSKEEIVNMLNSSFE